MGFISTEVKAGIRGQLIRVIFAQLVNERKPSSLGRPHASPVVRPFEYFGHRKARNLG